MSLSNEQKIQIAQSVLESLESQKERILLLSGEDPDSFEISSIDFNEEVNILKYGGLKEIYNKIQKIENRINNL